MSPAGAANCDRQIAFPFRDVVRNHISQVVLEPIDELTRRTVPLHECNDRAVAARSPTQRRNEMWIGQTADVETRSASIGTPFLYPKLTSVITSRERARPR